ncbi:MAG TPA: arginine--tRNA ligase [bacterium]|jgi:arginyl-tRNA synthetase|nr:arginine--tRNA ligase [bacterium]HOG37866.1 arginine--tRNA ligase [bacterium]HQI03083.1 arginine--tRNA ligase [bacterium]
MFEYKIKKLIENSTEIKNPEIEIPPKHEMGDYAFPCFELSKKLNKPAPEIANKIVSKIKKPSFIKEIKIIGPYINFFIDYASISRKIICDIFKEKNNYGVQNIGKNKTIVIDFSSPNIAKPLNIGHLRSTVIGNSLYKIHKTLGYKVIRVNHLGDWGTQFGKLIYAYKTWSNSKELKKDPIKHLFNLYVKFHKESKLNLNLDDLARNEFQKLEKKDRKNLELWKLFRSLSLEEFKKIYKILNIQFDSYDGEASYVSQSEKTLKIAKKLLNTKISEGALIVDLEKFKMPPFFLVKSNETSSYHLRDLSAALYRLKNYKPYKLLYVVGSEQELHFKQLFKILDLMKLNKNRFFHINFGMFSFSDNTMSTREGNIILLEDVINKSIDLAKKIMQEKNSIAKDDSNIAKKIGIGAVIFGDLSNDRNKNIVFNWSRVLAFDGDTSPYLQYTYVRCLSILKKAKKEQKLIPDTKINYKLLQDSQETKLIKDLSNFKKIIIKSGEEYKPNILANYLIDLAKDFNEFYNNVKVITDDKNSTKAKIALVYCVSQVIKNGLNLLGIETVNKM